MAPMVTPRGDALRQLREASGAGVVEFARKASIGNDTLAKIERSDRVRFETLISYCKALGLRTEEYIRAPRAFSGDSNLRVTLPLVLNFRPEKWPDPNRDDWKQSRVAIAVCPVSFTSTATQPLIIGDIELKPIEATRDPAKLGPLGRLFDGPPCTARNWVSIDDGRIPVGATRLSDGQWRGETPFSDTTGSAYHAGSVTLLPNMSIAREMLFKPPATDVHWSELISILQQDGIRCHAGFRLLVHYRIGNETRCSAQDITINLGCLIDQSKSRASHEKSKMARYLQAALVGGELGKCLSVCCSRSNVAHER